VEYRPQISNDQVIHTIMEQLIAINALFVGCFLIYKFSVEKKNGQIKCGIYYFAIFKK